MKVYAVMLESLSLLSGHPGAQLVCKMMESISLNHAASPGFTEDMFLPPQFASPLSMEFVAKTLPQASLPYAKSLDDAVALKLSLTKAKKAGLCTTVVSMPRFLRRNGINAIAFFIVYIY